MRILILTLACSSILAHAQEHLPPAAVTQTTPAPAPRVFELSPESLALMAANQFCYLPISGPQKFYPVRGPCVAVVHPGSAAAQAGFRSADRVLSVNGESFAKLSVEDFIKRLNHGFLEPVTLEIERIGPNGRTFKKKILIRLKQAFSSANGLIDNLAFTESDWKRFRAWQLSGLETPWSPASPSEEPTFKALQPSLDHAAGNEPLQGSVQEDRSVPIVPPEDLTLVPETWRVPCQPLTRAGRRIPNVTVDPPCFSVVLSGGSAWEGGLTQGDQLIAINKVPFKSIPGMQRNPVLNHGLFAPVTFTIRRRDAKGTWIQKDVRLRFSHPFRSFGLDPDQSDFLKEDWPKYLEYKKQIQPH